MITEVYRSAEQIMIREDNSEVLDRDPEFAKFCRGKLGYYNELTIPKELLKSTVLEKRTSRAYRTIKSELRRWGRSNNVSYYQEVKVKAYGMKGTKFILKSKTQGAFDSISCVDKVVKDQCLGNDWTPQSFDRDWKPLTRV